mgnify:CR=1 FL=1
MITRFSNLFMIDVYFPTTIRHVNLLVVGDSQDVRGSENVEV